MATGIEGVTAVEKKFTVEVVYNGVSKKITVEPEERVSAVLQRAIAAFSITQNAHLLALFRQDGTEVPDGESVERAGLRPGEVLLLRPSAVRGGTVLSVSGGIVPETFRTFLKCGRGRRECVAYWIGPAGDGAVDDVEHPAHTPGATVSVNIRFDPDLNLCARECDVAKRAGPIVDSERWWLARRVDPCRTGKA